jgi:DNA polymerase-3 subunit epsilon
MTGFDLETTGVDRFRDRPVSLALVRMAGGRVVKRQVAMVDPGCEVPAAATAVHGITTEEVRRSGMPLDEAMGMLVGELLAASARGEPLVGMRLDFDLTIVDSQCRRLDGRGLVERGWGGPALDTHVLDRRLDRYRRGRRTLGRLCEHYGVRLDGAHDAGVDAEASLGVLQALARRFPVLATQSPAELHGAQVSWHEEWAGSYDRWRRAQGLSPLEPEDFLWPIAVRGEALAAAS